MGRGDSRKSVNKSARYRKDNPEAWSNRLIKTEEMKSFAFSKGNKYSKWLVYRVWSRAIVCFREHNWDPW